MTTTALTARAKDLWEHLAGTTAGFAAAVTVTPSQHSRLCPPGWVGIVVINGEVLATAPDHHIARLVEQALSGLAADSLTSTAALASRLPIEESLGPAALAYLDPACFRLWPADDAAEPLELDHPDITRYLHAASSEDLEESGIQAITSPAFAVREQGQVAAVAGYRDWPCAIAHLSVLTAAAARGRGLARAAASAAVTHAVNEGRLPQWRAQPEASRRIARALGFTELGTQLSFHLTSTSL